MITSNYKFTFIFIVCLAIINCGTPTNKSKNVIGPNSTSTNSSKPKNETPTIAIPSNTNVAVKGNFNGDAKIFYAQVDNVASRNGTTVISFEDNRYPNVSIPKTYGGTLATMVMDGFDRDLLLVTAKLDDPNFNKYFLYVLRNNTWKPVMNGFAIHKSHRPDTLQVIRTNPKKPNELIRYYSVFDLDNSKDAGYVWRLLEESVVKEAW